MPLNPQDVASWDLAHVDEAMQERIDKVKGITEGHKDWSQIPADTEGLTDLPTLNEDLNVLGERRDAIAASAEMQGKVARLEEFLKTPVSRMPAQPAGKSKDFADLFQESNLAAQLKAGNKGYEQEFPMGAFFKAITGEDASLAGVDVDYPVRADRISLFVDELFQQPNIAALIPQTTTTSNSIEYVTEDYTSAAAETAEGATIAEATADFALATSAVRKIAVAVEATEEVLSDVGLLRGLVQGRLRADLLRREDLQILKGNGTPPNLDGIIGFTGVGNENYSLAAGTDAFLEAIFKASTTVREAFLNPSVAVMNAGSWETLRLEKASTGGSYLLGPVSDAVPARIWGLRVVINQNMDDNLIATEVPVLVGDFAGGALIARNGGVTVSVTDSHASNFTADVLTFKASMREALIIHRGPAFATVTVTA